jgi:superfamily II DNA or RNA helicase
MTELFTRHYDSGGHEVYKPAPQADLSDLPLPVDDAPCEDVEVLDDTWGGEPEPTFVMRPYQDTAVANIEAELYGRAATDDTPPVEPHPATLLVMATGLGKTVCIAQVVKRRKPGKVLVLAHRSELIYQAKATLESMTGEPVAVEMAEQYARTDANIIVATVQTLSRGRALAWKPEDFSLIVTDEGHHSTASSYGKIYKHFFQNPNLKHLGVTATPDRADEEALGKVFHSVAMTYEIADAIRDGWLVPITAVPVHVAGLDFSHIRTTAGDLNGADLAAVMEEETPLHEMVQAVVEIVCRAPAKSLTEALTHETEEDFHSHMAGWAAEHLPRKTLIFAASVKHAERLAEIINRWLPGRATWVCGETPKDERKQLFADFKAGRYMFLVNVGVCTEGWDEPGVEVVVMARPTKSRALYTQMLGRGTRALPGTVDGPATPELRKAAIAASAKPSLTCIDFVGNCGKHSLMTPADILGGNYEDDVVAKAKKILEDGDGRDVQDALDEAAKKVAEEKAREAARRAKVRVGANYTVGKIVDVFKMMNIVPQREREWERGKQVTPGMKKWLEQQKLWQKDMTYATARQLCQGMSERREKGLCSIRQAKLIARYGFPADTSFTNAKRIITALVKNNWRLPQGFHL